MELTDFISRLDNVIALPSGTAATCPAHDDQVRSLMVNAGDKGGIVVKCHAGCAAKDVVGALGLSLRELMGTAHLVATYPYTDESGRLLWEVQRWANPKTFRCVPGLPPPKERVLFQMPAIAWARANGVPIYVVEGEKDVLALARLKLPATCNVGGAGKWLPQYSEMLAGLDVIVVADNDDPGRAHARTVAAALSGRAKTVTLMHSPHGKDVSDLLDAGYTVDLLQLLTDTEGTPVYTASAITTRAVTWAWPGYVPFGKLTIIDGDPGDGKSLLTLDLAARWSAGAPMPDGTGAGPARRVMLVSAEDDLDDTIVPRLRAAQADLDMVRLVPHGLRPELPFDFTADLDWLIAWIIEDEVKVVVFDPLSAFLGERTDSHNDVSTRRALQPLRMLASRSGASVIAVRHLNKAGTGKVLYRGGGSIGFIGAARAGFLVAPHPEEPTRRVFAATKMNLTRKPPTLTFEIEVSGEHPQIKWGEVLDMGAQQILDGPEKKPDEDSDELMARRNARLAERQFLLDVLSDGPKTWVEIVEAGRAEGYTARTLVRARDEIRLVKIFGVHGNASIRWARPADIPDARATPKYPHGVTTDSELGNPTLPLTTVSEPRPAPLNGGEVDKWSPEDDSPYPDGTTDVDRDRQLSDLALVCAICGSAEGVSRYGKPWWVVRCHAHRPTQYQGGEI